MKKKAMAPMQWELIYIILGILVLIVVLSLTTNSFKGVKETLEKIFFFIN